MANENHHKSNTDSTDLNLTAIINSLGSEALLENTESKAKTSIDASFDPNATLDYQQAGASFPELPFANEEFSGNAAGYTFEDIAEDYIWDVDGAYKQRIAALQDAEKLPGSLSGELKQVPLDEEEMDSQPEEASASLHNPRRRETSKATTPAANRLTPQSSRDTSLLGNLSSKNTGSLKNKYRPLNTAKSNYRIRGGGKAQRYSLRSPVFLFLSLILVAVGVGVSIFGISSIAGSVSNNSTGYEFNLTPAQTREAIDSRIPILVNYADTSIESTIEYQVNLGQFVYPNSRYQPDSPDPDAVSGELVSMPQEMTEEQMEGYYQGAYNAYSPEELATYFNGAYVLDMAHGELGGWNKLKYVNFNAASIDNEMEHLASIQGLSGDTVTISAQGVDSRGNRIIQGKKVVDGEWVLFFRIAACPFNEIYNASTLSEASIYITCTVASYDFFTGSDVITPQ